VIPPIPASVTYPTSFTEATSDAVFSNYMYAYHYDSRNRLAEKKLPGKGWEHLVYNNIDQVVATQDAVQQLTNKYTFTKYDGLGRVIMTGELTDTRTNLQITNALAPQTVNWETPVTTGDGYTTGTSWPTSWNLLYTVNYYDDYSYPGGTTYTSAATGITTNTRGLQTGSKVRNMVTGNMLLTTVYYDAEARPRETIAQNNISGTDRVVNEYNFTGQLVKATRTHISSTLANLVIVNENTYDHMGRKLRSLQKTGSSDKVVISKLEYNEIGQLKTKSLHGVISGADTTYMQPINYTYNPRGWLKSSSAPLFAMQLNYQDADHGITQQYNGNIANQYWGTPSNLGKYYDYSYDALNRLTAGVSNNGFKEQGPTPQGIEYDYLGNILKLQRIDGLTTAISNYTYNYLGNQLQTVTGLTASTYHYDNNGNADHDGHTGRDITYNYLNLPQTVNTAGNTSTITYTYDATGNKLKRISSTVGVGTTDYDNGIVYDNGTIFAQTEEGRVLNLNGTLNYEYNLSDHLGNTRVTFDTALGYAQVVQTNDYFPFGLQHTMATSQGSPPNNYLYNKKELQVDLGQYDYGARFYDPVIGRWNAIDPHAENYQNWTTYNYVANNPMLLTDPDGRDWFYHSSDGKKDPTWIWHNGKTYDTGVKGNDGNNVILQGQEAVVVFEGSMDEKLGSKDKGDEGYDSKHKNGYIDGKGAKTAKVTVYGPDGPNDIGHYTGYTMSSDPDKYGVVANGDYSVNFRDPGKSGALHSNWAVNNTEAVPDLWTNPMNPKQVDKYGQYYSIGIYIHTSNQSGYSGTTSDPRRPITSGCLLISPTDWKNFNNQLNGVKTLLLQLRRESNELHGCHTF
jgi:RHS repeat-associated protein